VRSQDATVTGIAGIAARVQDAFSGTALPSEGAAIGRVAQRQAAA
jgi:hypothetical protein